MGGGIGRTGAQCCGGETGLRRAAQCCSHVTRLIWCRLCMLFSSSLLLLLLFCDPDSCRARRAAAVGMSADADGEYDADGGYVYVAEQGEDDVSGLQQFWLPGLTYPSTEVEDRGELGVQSPLGAQVLGPARHCHCHCPPRPALPCPDLPALSLRGPPSVSWSVGRLARPPCSSCPSLTCVASLSAPCPGERVSGGGGGAPWRARGPTVATPGTGPWPRSPLPVPLPSGPCPALPCPCPACSFSPWTCLSLTSLASFPAPCPGEPEPGI